MAQQERVDIGGYIILSLSMSNRGDPEAIYMYVHVYMYIIAERLSARQLILHHISPHLFIYIYIYIYI